MSTPTVSYKMLAKGYSVRGNLREGYQAKVPFLVAWADAFTFADQVMGVVRQPSVAPPAGQASIVQAVVPWIFPGSASARLYATDFEIQPIGSNGEPLPTYYGLRPGEFFTHAIVTVTFETPHLQWQALDDPGNLQQLDPANPITLCDQSIKGGGQIRTRRGSGYVYSDSKSLQGDIGVPEKQARLVLKFPRLPYLPWQQWAPYYGSVNDRSVLGCATGTLIFEGCETQFTATTSGIQGQMAVMEFTWQPFDWNQQNRPDTGALDFVYQKGHAGDSAYRIFSYMNFAEMFPQYQVSDI